MKPNLLRSILSPNRYSLTAITVAVITALFLYGAPILDLLELQTYDLRYLSRSTMRPSPSVVLATIDEQSLDLEGRWPWSRSKIAALVDRLSRDGAKVIVFDVGFLESESTEADGALARAILESEAAVVLGYFFHMGTDELSDHIDEAEIARRLETIAPSKYGAVMHRGVDTDATVFPIALAPEVNIAPLSAAADGSGYFSVKQDPDGVVRWMPLVIQAGEELFPPLSLVAAWQYLGRPLLKVDVGPYGVEGIHVGDRSIPTDASGRLLINYAGPAKTFPHVSAGAILRGEIPAGTFRDRIALVGVTATGLYDVRATPFGPVYPGAEIHATVIDNVLTGRFVAKPAWAKVYDVLAILLLAVLIAVVLPRLSAFSAILFSGGVSVLHVFVARQLFVSFGIWLNVVYPLLAVAAIYTLLSAHRFVVEQQERRKLRSAFGHYVAPVVIEAMLENPALLELGGEERVLTVLFSDLQGFTSYVERYPPQEMIQLMSQYYARMTEQVFAHSGMLKEYVGDELMAIFGAPIENADHARLACLAALDMKVQRAVLSEEWAKRGWPRVIARTGINSGPMLVGNLGSEYRFAYGALGDNVNLGSRLEGLNKEYGTLILIGENTADLISDEFVLREIDRVRVVGKKKPTRIHELVGLAGDSIPREHGAALRAYEAALAAYRSQRWSEARDLLDEALRAWPQDGPSKVLSERCRVFAAEPPAPDWDGVFEATRK